MNNFDRTLEQRRQMTSVIERALDISPDEMQKLLQTIGEIYKNGNLPIWDILAVLAGFSRGNGNNWYFTALEIKAQKEAQK